MAECEHPQPLTDPFLDPWVSRLAGLVQAGQLPPEEMVKPYPPEWPLIPPDLLAFLRAASWPALLDAVRSDPRLYWHPIVRRQMSYLRRLRRDEELWIRLGWDPKSDFVPPTEVAQVQRMLEELVQAHVSGVLPGKQLIPIRARGKPGRKGGFENPYPTGPWDERVDAATLAEDFRRLRAAVKTALRTAPDKPGPTKADAKEWYRAIAQRVFEEIAEAGDALSWSDYKDYQFVKREPAPAVNMPPLHVGPRAPESPADGDVWLDTSLASSSPSSWRRHTYVERKYNAATAAWSKGLVVLAETEEEGAKMVRRGHAPFTEDVIVRWMPLVLDDALDRMLNHKMGHAGKQGRPAYLAYTVLSALLGVAPEKIYRALDNYRRRRRQKRRS